MSRIFISYSHRGNGPEWKAELLKVVAVFERHHLLDVWDDGKIRVSAAWNDDITQAMSSASLAVFLLTPEALESEFILKTELPFLCDRWERERIPVFSVVCEPCRWKEQEQSKWLHAIQSPAGSEPLCGFSAAIVDRHLRDLATAIAEELSRIALAECSSRREETLTEGSALGETKTYLDKFPLSQGPVLREQKLIGREQELALLDLAYASSFGVPPPDGPGRGAWAQQLSIDDLSIAAGWYLEACDEAEGRATYHRRDEELADAKRAILGTNSGKPTSINIKALTKTL